MSTGHTPALTKVFAISLTGLNLSCWSHLGDDEN